jgi:tetratricopeptide (TPR) repeat protein
MNLQRNYASNAPLAKAVRIQVFSAFFLLSWTAAAACAQNSGTGRPELIRDTAAAEGTESTEAEPTKEFNPLLAEQNINIGNFYLKRKNYAAAIQRFRDALEYQPDSVRACEALARAYEKNGDLSKAAETYRNFIEKNPDSPKSAEFRNKLEKLEKKSR